LFNKSQIELENNKEYQNLANETSKIYDILDNRNPSKQEKDKLISQLRISNQKLATIRSRIFAEVNKIETNRPSPYSKVPYIISSPRKGIEYKSNNTGEFQRYMLDTEPLYRFEKGGISYNMPFLQKENLLNQSKFSKFARGGMSGYQLYKFLFPDDYNNDENKQAVKENTAPSESELNRMKQQNQDLLLELNQANRRNAAFDVLNTPYDQSIYGSSYTSPDYSQYYGDKSEENQQPLTNTLPTKTPNPLPFYIDRRNRLGMPGITKIY
jgi:hypothetical protein